MSSSTHTILNPINVGCFFSFGYPLLVTSLLVCFDILLVYLSVSIHVICKSFILFFLGYIVLFLLLFRRWLVNSMWPMDESLVRFFCVGLSSVLFHFLASIYLGPLPTTNGLFILGYGVVSIGIVYNSTQSL